MSGRTDPAVRYHRYINVLGPDECWEWTASRFARGAGKFTDGSRKTVLAHRFGYKLMKGPIPDGMLVCHTCDNPPCQNPKHWFLGTPLDNMRDKMNKGRQVFPGPKVPAAGERNGNVKLTRFQVEEMRQIGRSKTQVAIAKQFNIGRTQVRRILDGESWNVQTNAGNAL